MYGAMPKEWVLTFEIDGGKVRMIVIARPFSGAHSFAPTGAKNVKARTRKTGGRK